MVPGSRRRLTGSGKEVGTEGVLDVSESGVEVDTRVYSISGSLRSRGCRAHQSGLDRTKGLGRRRQAVS
jgi:hypothetical protein